MLRVLGRNPACCCLVRVGRRSKPWFVRVRDTAFEDEVELMLMLRATGLFPIYFSDMQQSRDRNIRPDLFPAFAFERRDKVFARLLLSTRQREVPAFDRVLFFLDQ